MAQPRYKSPSPGHSIRSVSRSGDRVLLEDGSTWALDPADLPRVRCWSQQTAISVVARGNSHWLVARLDGHTERVLVGFRGYLSDSPDIITSWHLGVSWNSGPKTSRLSSGTC
jgi:hypothetical protein